MGVKQVIETAATQYKGVEYVVIGGQTIDDKHPLVKGRPELFQDVVPDITFTRGAPVEQATAAPGEKRNK